MMQRKNCHQWQRLNVKYLLSHLAQLDNRSSINSAAYHAIKRSFFHCFCFTLGISVLFAFFAPVWLLKYQNGFFPTISQSGKKRSVKSQNACSRISLFLSFSSSLCLLLSSLLYQREQITLVAVSGDIPVQVLSRFNFNFSLLGQSIVIGGVFLRNSTSWLGTATGNLGGCQFWMH